ncbi:unnamed protein product [Blepharisma stoltei]|uniref:Uncharacterized protein n=1 Tax=Blepharisma stoltei TaxID=1481888 RepID=A0AAU9IEX6_9CILI|nr:unnamed protein product [Blepharisma stoltei]
MNTCLLCQDICCPEHCCNWDECTCGDCDMCTPHSETQPTQTQAETQIPAQYNDNAKIILIGKNKESEPVKEKTRTSSELGFASLQNKEEYVFKAEETKEERKSLPNKLVEEEKSEIEDMYDIDLIRKAAGGGIHGIRYLKKKLSS